MAVSKALNDMRSHSRRSIRNLVDLGLLFSRGENLRRFYTTAQEILADPHNPYPALARRLVTTVDTNTVKMVGLNLGYSSLVYGAAKLKRRQREYPQPLPWLLILDWPATDWPFDQTLRSVVRLGQELGIYSYLICLHKADEIKRLCVCIEPFEASVFGLRMAPDLITAETAKILGGQHHVFCSLAAAGPSGCLQDPADLDRVSQACHLLAEQQCLFGLQIGFEDASWSQVARADWLKAAIRLGAAFVVYTAAAGTGEPCRRAVYEWIQHERSTGGQPVITLDWREDMRSISRNFVGGDGYLTIDLAKMPGEGILCPRESWADALQDLQRAAKSRRTCAAAENDGSRPS